MARKITVALEDDLDGGPAVETVRFSVGGALRARREEDSRVVTVAQRQTTKIPAGYGVSRWQRYSATDFPS